MEESVCTPPCPCFAAYIIHYIHSPGCLCPTVLFILRLYSPRVCMFQRVSLSPFPDTMLSMFHCLQFIVSKPQGVNVPPYLYFTVSKPSEPQGVNVPPYLYFTVSKPSEPQGVNVPRCIYSAVSKPSKPQGVNVPWRLYFTGFLQQCLCSTVL